jgi:hypothetical protein
LSVKERVASRSGDLQIAEELRRRFVNRRTLIAFTAFAAATSLFAETSAVSVTADWHQDAPGARHRITLADLPPPYSTKSVSNGPREVRPPAGAEPRVPSGFKIEQYASGFSYPRYLVTARTATFS